MRGIGTLQHLWICRDSICNYCNDGYEILNTGTDEVCCPENSCKRARSRYQHGRQCARTKEHACTTFRQRLGTLGTYVRTSVLRHRSKQPSSAEHRPTASSTAAATEIQLTWSPPPTESSNPRRSPPPRHPECRRCSV